MKAPALQHRICSAKQPWLSCAAARLFENGGCKRNKTVDLWGECYDINTDSILS